MARCLQETQKTMSSVSLGKSPQLGHGRTGGLDKPRGRRQFLEISQLKMG